LWIFAVRTELRDEPCVIAFTAWAWLHGKTSVMRTAKGERT
jgi:hypothetical protein